MCKDIRQGELEFEELTYDVLYRRAMQDSADIANRHFSLREVLIEAKDFEKHHGLRGRAIDEV